MRIAIPALLLAWIIFSSVRTLYLARESEAASFPARVLFLHLICAVWFVVGLVAVLQGGTALYGGVNEAEFFLRHNPKTLSNTYHSNKKQPPAPPPHSKDASHQYYQMTSTLPL
jgi:hypothetical protein